MGLGALIHLGLLAAAAAAWLLAPRELAPAAVLAVLAVGAATLGALITSPRTQLFVPTISRGPASSRALALTFDDGPDAAYTGQILDLLREAGARATFFVVGRAATGHPDLVRRIVAEGHLVASHTYSHAHSFHFWSARAMAEDIARGIEAVQRITGQRPAYFRPPQGLRVPTLRAAMARLSPAPSCVTWTGRGMDTVTRSPEVIVRRLSRSLLPGAILTLHDGTAFGGLPSRAPTVEALRSLLVMARARGLLCVRLDELLAEAPR